MIYLILSVLLSGILIMTIFVFRGYQLMFWMSFVNSKFINKSDLFIENLFKSSKMTLKRILRVLLLEGSEFFSKIKGRINLILIKITKKTNRQINKLYEQKVAEPSSDYLKNIERHKNGSSEDKKEVEF